MTTTAAATVAVSGSPVLELLSAIERDDSQVQCFRERRKSRLLEMRLWALCTLGLAKLSEANAPFRLTAAGRDLLDRCTRS